MLWLFTLPYLPLPRLPSAWTVSPAPLQAARLESLLGNKPKAPAASTRDPTGFITRSLTHFCCLNAGAWAQFNFRAKTALPSYGDAPYQKTTQEPPALSPWAFQHTWERHPQGPNCITVQSTHHSHTKLSNVQTTKHSKNTLLQKPRQDKPSLLRILKPYHRCYVQIFK